MGVFAGQNPDGSDNSHVPGPQPVDAHVDDAMRPAVARALTNQTQTATMGRPNGPAKPGPPNGARQMGRVQECRIQ